MYTDDDMSVGEMKSLRDKIYMLQETEHIEIFKIIKQDTDKFSENKNGIFVNLSKMSITTLKKIKTFVEFCSENKKKLEIEKKQRDSLKDSITTNNNDFYDSDISDESDVNENNNENESVNSEDIDFNKESIDNITSFEKEIIYSKFNNSSSGQNKINGVRAKIIKKSKESNS